MPIGKYKDFASCVAANSHLSDPKAYCGAIERRVNKDKVSKSLGRFAPIFKSADIAHADHNQVFGWASVVIAKNGSVVSDFDGHSIPVAELEWAAYDFMKGGRASGELHRGSDQGVLIESMVFTPQKIAKMGIPEGTVPVGWWVGFEMPPATFAKVKSGRYKAFSIQGAARAVPID